jgi:hypothetical protein
VDVALRLCFVALAACSVPDVALEGKQCPCTSGYTCGTDMRCHSMIDAGKKDGMPMGTSCLGSDPGMVLFTDSFDAAMNFTPDMNNGTWTQSGGALQQTDPSSGLTFAYTTMTSVSLQTYRVVSTMTGTSPGTAMGIAVRFSSGPKTYYDCLWEPGGTGGSLLWQSIANNGTATTMGTPVITTPNEHVTMEVLADHSTLKCCIDGNAAAMVTVTNPTPSYPSGYTGVVVNDMVASFEDFTVYAN